MPFTWYWARHARGARPRRAHRVGPPVAPGRIASRTTGNECRVCVEQRALASVGLASTTGPGQVPRSSRRPPGVRSMTTRSPARIGRGLCQPWSMQVSRPTLAVDRRAGPFGPGPHHGICHLGRDVGARQAPVAQQVACAIHPDPRRSAGPWSSSAISALLHPTQRTMIGSDRDEAQRRGSPSGTLLDQGGRRGRTTACMRRGDGPRGLGGAARVSAVITRSADDVVDLAATDPQTRIGPSPMIDRSSSSSAVNAIRAGAPEAGMIRARSAPPVDAEKTSGNRRGSITTIARPRPARASAPVARSMRSISDRGARLGLSFEHPAHGEVPMGRPPARLGSPAGQFSSGVGVGRLDPTRPGPVNRLNTRFPAPPDPGS